MVIASITARVHLAVSGRVLVWRQGVLLLRYRLLRWRLETYGVDMPSLPPSRPGWRVNGWALSGLIGHRRAYGGWLREMAAVRVSGGPGWWRCRLAGKTAAWEAYLWAVNGFETDE